MPKPRSSKAGKPKSEKAKSKSDLIHGTLDLLILRTLASGELHGWAISKRIRQLSDEVLTVNQGSLYPALYRLEDRGWIRAEWRTSDRGRRAKFYTLTAAGARELDRERTEWAAFIQAVEQVLREA